MCFYRPWSNIVVSVLQDRAMSYTSKKKTSAQPHQKGM